jgi:hypothetical protein
MIISHKHKYIFIGLPFSASSAISKELIEQYDGEYILNKHANIQTFLSSNKLNINNYTIFAVYRDLEEILFTRYNKYKYNSKEVYTNPSFLVKNGGHVTAKALNIHNRIINEDIDFEDFIVKFSKSIPYDFVFSINAPYVTDILNFNNLSPDFDRVLAKIGFTNRRELPLYNKTEKKDQKPEISEKVRRKYIYPYKIKTSKFSASKIQYKSSIFNNLVFNFFHIIREKRWLKDDLKRSDSKDSYFSSLVKNK